MTQNKQFIYWTILFLIILSVSVHSEGLYHSYLHTPTVPEGPKINILGSYSTNLYSGTATYELPFEIPPGTNGLQPELKLLYNHQQTKLRPGIFGTARDLNIPFVQRNINYTIDEKTDDFFELFFNGIKYRLIYVPAEDRYHTEIETFLSIKKVSGGDNDLKEYWVIKDTSGKTYRFGYKKESESVSNQGTFVWRWNLDQITDTDNNNIYFSYIENPSTEDLGATYLSEITYNNEMSRKLKFIREDSVRPDIWTVYDQGQKITESRRIKEIQFLVNNKLIHKYSLDYTSVDHAGKTFLKSITLFGSDGQSKLPPTIFEYHSSEEGWEKFNTPLPWEVSFQEDSKDLGVRLIDVNRDGFTDIIKSKENDQKVWIYKNNGWVLDNNWKLPANAYFVEGSKGDLGLRFAELNGDGFIDLIKGNGAEQKSKAWINTGSGWVENNNWVPPVEARFVDYDSDTKRYYSKGVEIIDLNGDGKDDLIKGNGNSKAVWINAGSGWKSSSQWNLPIDISLVDEEYVEADYGGATPGEISFTYKGIDQGVRFADINGDGLPDLLKASGTNCNNKKVWLNNGKGWDLVYSGGNTNLWNLDDEMCFISSGSTSFYIKSVKYKIYALPGIDRGIRLVDVNGDGLTDLLKASDTDFNNNKVWLNNGHGWDLAYPGGNTALWNINSEMGLVDSNGNNEDRRLSDINGDGLVDFVKKTGACCNPSNNEAWINKVTQPYLLSKVKNNLGGELDLDYQESTIFDNTGSDALSDLGFNMWIVKSKIDNNGMDGKHQIIATSNYNYTDGFYDSVSKEFRGFAYAEETKPDSSTVKHYFYQDDGKKGKEYKTEIVDQANNLYTKKEQDWSSIKNKGYYLTQLDSIKDYTYDGVNNDPKVSTLNYAYDNYGNPTSIHNVGESSTNSDDRYEHYEYIYNTNNWIVNKPKRYWLNNKNDNTKITETKFYYDSLNYGQAPIKGKLTKTESLINGNNYKTYTSTYNQYGNVLSKTDSLGHTASYQYDSSNTFPIKVTNAKGQILQYSFDAGTGNPLSETDPNSQTTNYKYDVFGRNTKIIKPYDSENKPTILYEYSFDGTPPEKITEKNREVSGTSNTYDTDYYYDGLGNLIQTKSDAENTQKQIVSDYYYDELNRLKEESNSYPATKTTSFTTPQDVAKTSYSYDPLSRITKIKNPDGTSKELTYLHYQVIAYDENDNSKEYWYNALGNIIKVLENDGNKVYETDYEYREDGNLLKVTDDSGNEFKFTYDNLGRLTQLTDPDLGLWTYTYDSEGNLLQQSANGKVITMQYDTLNRITKKTADGKSNTFTYDQNKIGALSKVTTPTLTTEYQYDNRLRLINEKKIIDGTTFENAYEYDALDRVTKVKSGGQDFTYTFNEQGKEDKISLSGTEVIKNFNYNQYGQVTERQYKNNLNTLQNYNSQNFRLSSITTSTLQDLSFGYDAVGNVLTIKDKANAQDYTMTYDDLDRLKSATKTGTKLFTISYNYNSIGNMLDFTQDGEKYLFSYSGKPVHSPQSLSTPTIIVNEGCTYNNPPCAADQNCVNNVCVKKNGCQYNNPACGASEDCVNNMCVLKKGCIYNNPFCKTGEVCENNICIVPSECIYDSDCSPNYICINKKCALKSGCTYNNPPCSEDKNCINSECVPKEGCFYNNPQCTSNQDCINNICLPKTGCQYNNPACGTNELCQNNVCVKKSGCAYDNPLCSTGYQCVDNACIEERCESEPVGELYCKGKEIYQKQTNSKCQIIEILRNTCRNSCNNGSCMGVALADLSIPSALPPPQITWSKKDKLNQFVFEVIITNKGDVAANMFSWRMWDNSGNTVASSGNSPIAELKPGNEHIVYPNFNHKDNGPFKFMVDSGENIKEYLEDNNIGCYSSTGKC